jgi:hypothetical protein
MDSSERERLRQQVMDYWIAYYSELRRELPNYTSNPETKQIPEFFRTHRRYLDASEFADGYVIVHRTVPEEEFDQVAYWETFRIEVRHTQTVGAATQRDYPPYGDFVVSETLPLRDTETGEYADAMPPERMESRDFISNNRVATMYTQENARADAQRNLREFLAQHPIREDR